MIWHLTTYCSLSLNVIRKGRVDKFFNDKWYIFLLDGWMDGWYSHNQNTVPEPANLNLRKSAEIEQLDDRYKI